jgi:hypothetical protein
MPACPLHVRAPSLPWLVAAALCAGGLTPAAEPPASDAPPPAHAPHVPEAVSRPEGWPRGSLPPGPDPHVLSSIRRHPGAPFDVEAAAAGAIVRAAFEAPPGSAPAPAAVAIEEVPLETARVVARVGPEVVLESDLLTPKALEWLASVSAGLKPEQVRQLRLQICRQVIDPHVETLLVYVDALREIPEDKLPEIRQNVDKAFEEQMLPQLMREAGAANSAEYSQQLRAKGQSLERMRKMFFERGLAQEWLRKNASFSDDVPHADMIAWYQAHLTDYDYPARARFEALTVKTGLKRQRRQAWDMLAEMGNEVLAGRPFADVAKSRSEGPTAAAGGVFDWTTKGSLASKLLDEAIFSLPVDQLSSIIEDEQALHIVRVVERREAGRTPFIEAQVAIRDRLVAERREKAQDEYLAKLRARTPVWTVFEEPQGEPLVGAASADSTVRR